MTLELYLALWGAILSTLLALLKIITFINDRPRIKVKAEFVYNSCSQENEVKGTLLEDPNRGLLEVLLHFNIVNCGRKPIQVTGIIIDSVGPRYSQVIPNNFPVVLDPLTSIDTHIQKEWIDKEEVYFLGVVDALGKRYSISKVNLIDILRITKKLPSNKTKYMHKETGEIVYAFPVKDEGRLVEKNVR